MYKMCTQLWHKKTKPDQMIGFGFSISLRALIVHNQCKYQNEF